MAADISPWDDFAPGVDGVDVKPVPLLALVVGTFLLGWVFGVAIVYKLGTFSGAPRGLLESGWTYVGFMVLPLFTGAFVTRLCARLSARGWGWPSVRGVLLGMAVLFLGLLVA